MPNPYARLFKKRYLMNRLMQIYSFVIVGVIVSTAIILCVFMAQMNQKKMHEEMTLLEDRLANDVIDKENTMSYMYTELTGGNQEIENIHQYLTLSSSDYFDYTQAFWEKTQMDNRLSSKVSSFFTAFPDLEKLYVQLDDSPGFLVADRKQPNGKKGTGEVPKQDGLVMTRMIMDPFNRTSLGTISAVFSKRTIFGESDQHASYNGIDAFILDRTDQFIFKSQRYTSDKVFQTLETQYKQTGKVPQKIEQQYYVIDKQTSRDFSFIILGSKKVIWKKNSQLFIQIGVVSLILILILLTILKRTFKNYLIQIQQIGDTMHQVATGDLSQKIKLDQMQDELLDLSEEINEMITSLDRYIKDNYQLELQEKDAQMRALQSQINPHFLYNTLEYIRMYAVSKQQMELAEVVYAFAALLRNNTQQEKMITLKKELSFCEKYVYLYQMRYPDCIAYHFDIEPKWADILIPKFCIQPLIENYFVHGIDYTRTDNAISVKAFGENDELTIIIKDNGKGMSAARLAEVKAQLEQHNTTSIGVSNVYQRLHHYFKDQFDMTITSQEQSGTTITLHMKGVEQHVSSNVSR